MADELHPFDQALFPYESADGSHDTLHKAGRVAVAVAIASTLAAGPVDADAYELPQATPIVHVLQPLVPDIPAVVADEPAEDEDESVWQRLMKMLKYALIVLLLLGVCIFGAIKGCAAVASAPLLPAASSSSSSAEAATDAPAAAAPAAA